MRRSRTLPLGRARFSTSEQEQEWSGVVASSLYSRSVNTEPIKTSRSSSPVLCSSGSSFNGAFLPECVSDQCFRTAVTAAALCQWKYALALSSLLPSVRPSGSWPLRLSASRWPGTPRRRWWPWPPPQHNEKRFSENRARIWAAIEARLRPHCAAGSSR